MKDNQFPFEWLPAELRENVYFFLLVVGKIDIRLVMSKALDHCDSSKVVITGRNALSQQDQITPAVLRTSRQIYNEALPILYSKNTFSFMSLTSLRQFARDARSCLPLLRHIEIATTGRFALWQPLQQLLRADNLRTMVISVGPDDVRDKGWSELVLELADFVVRKASASHRRRELAKISLVASGRWEASGSAEYRSCGSDSAAEQVRRRVEQRLTLMSALPEG